MESVTRTFLKAHIVAGFAAALMITPAHAQVADGSTQSPQQLGISADPGQVPSQPSILPAPQPVPAARWSQTGGFETDTHGTGYGFFGPSYSKPFRPNMAWVAGVNVNYLFYEYQNAAGGGETNVRAPGVNARAGLKFGEKNYFQATAGPSFKRRNVDVFDAAGTRMSSGDDFRVGVNVGSEAWVEPTTHSVVYGILDFSGADSYTWGRLAFREQVSNRTWSNKFAHFVGAEVIGQGNDDIKSTQVGANFEIVHVPSSVSLQVRGGWKRSTFEFGPDKTGPWFAIGFWQRLR